MLHARPEIHGNCTELNLNLHHLLFILKEYRYLNYKVKTSVTAWLRILDIILSLDKHYIVLL